MPLTEHDATTNHNHAHASGHVHQDRENCSAPQVSSGAATAPGATPEQSELQSLQNEIVAKLQEPRKAGLPWSSAAVTAVLGLLALVSIAQVVQSVLIYNKLKSGDIGPGSAVVAPAGSDSLQNQPDMVGGC